MKIKIKSVLIVILVSGFLVSVGQGYNRVVIFEYFTSTTCPPCATWAPIMDQFLEQTGTENLVEIAYHMNWPGAGNDPFYLNNPSENSARRTYYGINAVPNLMVDGILGTSVSNYSAWYNQRHNVPAPLDIDINITVGTQINVTAVITAENYFSGSNLKFRSALISKEYDIPGGGWTYTHVEWAMVDMAPNSAGINFNISPGQTVTLNASYPMPNYPPTGLDNFAVVGFVQNDATREVHQAAYAPIPLDYPSLSLVDFTVEDPAPGGNGNNLPEPGESCELWVELQNGEIFAPATDITGALSTTDPGISITTNQASFPNIAPGASGTNEDSPFVFEVAPDFEAHAVEFRMDITANGGAYTSFVTFSFMVGIPQILLVDDDGGSSYESTYTETLDEIDRVYDVWEVETQGVPTGTHLSNYNTVIWFTGMETAPINADEQTALAYYMDYGGKLLLTSENIGDDIGSTTFYTDYMHAQHGEDHISVIQMEGVEGDPISDNMQLLLVGGAFWPESQSSIFPDAEAFPIFTYNNTTQDCGGLRYSGDYHLVYLPFPLECVSPVAIGFTHIDEALQAILEWFDSLSGSQITITLTPYNTPIQIPANGGNLEFNIAAVNDSSASVTVDVWTMVTLPNGTPYGPLIDVSDFVLTAGMNIERDRVQAVPASAPAGDYTYDAYLGDYPDDIWSEDHFPFEKLTVSDGGIVVNDWEQWGENFADGENSVLVVIDDFTLYPACPNPFNPSTVISYQLAADSYVELKVYDIMGREVQSLFRGQRPAGQYEAVFDGSGLRSGVYFVRLEAGSAFLTQKMLLLK